MNDRQESWGTPDDIIPDTDGKPVRLSGTDHVFKKRKKRTENRNYKWEAAGSLTPELEGTPRSATHRQRAARPPEAFPGSEIPPPDMPGPGGSGLVP